MYHGDRSRKEVLVEHGFRLPSALDNRPLNFAEWESARPPGGVRQRDARAATSCAQAGGVIVEQIIRPTGLVDPVIDVRPVEGQIDDLLAEIREVGGARRARARHDADQAHGRGPDAVLPGARRAGPVSALGHRHARARARFCATCGWARSTCWSASTCCARGSTCPEVSLVAILDADKEGFLRSAGALIQTMGRAARHVNGRAILYADAMTDSMRQAMEETERRRAGAGGLQPEHGITPASIIKNIDDVLASVYERDYVTVPKAPDERERSRRRRSSTRSSPASNARCGRRPRTWSSSAPPRCAIA